MPSLRAKQRQIPTRPPRTPPRTPVPDLGEPRAGSSTAGLRPRWPPSSRPRRPQTALAPPDGYLSRQGPALHNSHPAGPNPDRAHARTRHRRTRRHFTAPPPTRPSIHRDNPATPKRAGPPTRRASGHRTANKRTQVETLSPSSPNNSDRPLARSGDTGPHRRPPRVLPRVLRVLPRVLRRVLRPLTWGFTPPAATPRSWSPTIRTFARRHRYPPPFTAVAAWSTGLDGPTASIPPAATSCPPPPSAPQPGVLQCLRPAAAADQGGLDRLGEARTPSGQPGRGPVAGFPGRLPQPGEAGVQKDAGSPGPPRCEMGL